MTKRCIPLLALLLSLGCERFDVAHLAALEDAVLAVDDVNGIARIVGVAGTDPEITDIDLAEGFARILARPGAPGEVVVFTQGTLGDEEEDPVPSQLVHLDASGELGRWTFERQYAEAGTSTDGRYVYAREPWGRLVVENNVEVVDLTLAASETNPFPLSLRSLGGETPTAAAFSEPFAWPDGGDLRIGALFASGQLSLFDLAQPDLPPVTIPTTVEGASMGPRPVEVLFVDDELVVRAASGNQLLVVTLAPQTGVGMQRFEASLRTLATAETVTSMAVDRRGTTPRLIALSGSRLHVYELATGIETVLDLPEPYEHILAFDGPAPGDSTSRPRLALWGLATSITFVDLGEDAESVIDSMTIPLAFTPDEVVADAELGRLVVFRVLRNGSIDNDVAGSFARVPTSVIDLHDRSAIALATTADVTRAVVSTELDAVWVANDQGYVSRFDVATHEQEELWLEDNLLTLLPLYGEAQRVLAFHRIGEGRFTVLSGGEDPRLFDGVF